MPRTRAEELAGRIAEMDRSDLIALLRTIKCPFRMDFTDEFLSAVSLERLRHIVLAACLRGQPARPRRR